MFSSMTELEREKWTGRLILILIGIGTVLRLNRFLCNFPLWGDEAWVGWEVVVRSMQEIVLNTSRPSSLPLPPIGFLLTEKFLVMLFGVQEFVYRIFPCACGVASVFVFARLLKTLVPARARLIALAFFVFSNSLLYYSSEMKQYSSDVLLVVIIYSLHFRVLGNSMDGKSTLGLAVAGMIGIFFSLPLVLVLCGTSLAQIALYFRTRQRKEAVRYVLVLSLWLAGFWYMWQRYYHVNYVGGNAGVLCYWEQYKLSSFLAQGAWDTWLHKLFSVFQDPVGLSWPWLAALMFATGCWSWWRQKKEILLPLVLPVLLTIGLSTLDKYPFHGRYLIFLLPIFFILIAQGVECVINACLFRKMLGVAILIVLLAQPIANARNYVFPLSDTDIRSLMLYIRTHQGPNDAVYFNNDTIWGYYFYYVNLSLQNLKEGGVLYEYSQLADVPGQLFYLMSSDRSEWRRVYSWDRVIDQQGARTRMLGGGRTWILLSQLDPAKENAFIRCFNDFGKKLDEVRSRNASLYLYDLK